MTVGVAVFWASLAWVGYVYLGYPLCLAILARLKRPLRQPRSVEPLPAVTLIVSAYNEEAVIAAKVENALALDYPGDRFEVIVVSDACTDRTDEIVRSCRDERVRLLRVPERGGKTAGLNAAVPLARGEVLVFSDANAMYVPRAIRALVAPFADPSVGAVTGEQRYHAAARGSAGEGEGLYWRLELRMKKMESVVSSVVGGDGAIYAVRRQLYRPMKPEDVSDFVNPLQIVLAGYRNVYAPEAVAYEHSGDSDHKEFRRKVRIVNQSWRACLEMPAAWNPLRSGIFGWQVLSHKVMRWWTLVPLVLALVSGLALSSQGRVYVALNAAQLACYTLALCGAAWPSTKQRPRIVSIPYYFLLVQMASFKGLVESMRGTRYATWTTVRELDRDNC